MRRRALLGLNYWSLSAYLKQKVKNALEYICRFEEAVADDVRARGFDGVVCGHIHHAAIKTICGIVYHNDGDWVESCTALVEDARGHLEILRWADAGVRPLTVPAGRAAEELRTPFPPEGPPESKDMTGAGHCWRRPPMRLRMSMPTPSDRDRRLGAAGERRGAHAGDTGPRSRSAGPRSALRHAGGPLHAAASDLFRDPAGGVPAPEPREDDRQLQARRDPHRHRRHAGLERARDLPQAAHSFHHLVPHAVSRLCACALSLHSARAPSTASCAGSISPRKR